MTSRNLNGSVDLNFRAIQDSQPGFAFARDFGEVAGGQNSSMLLSIGHYRDPAV